MPTMQLMLGSAVSVSSTLRLARAWSMSSARTSTSVILVPETAALMPSTRSRALSAPGRPTKPMHLPPSGMAFFISSPACLPASTLLEPI